MRGIKGASIAFRSMLTDGGLKPSTFLLGRMRDDASCRDIGEEHVPMSERVEIATKLVQYELPRLAQIQGDIGIGDRKSQDDWVREFALGEGVSDTGETLQ
jgi:hypothetical protein